MSGSDRDRPDGRRALVTGGSKGSGKAVVERLREMGADMYVTARTMAAGYAPTDETLARGGHTPWSTVPRSPRTPSPREQRGCAVSCGVSRTRERPPGYTRRPTASRYSCSKRARSSVPRFHSRQNAAIASSNSRSRPSRPALARVAMVGP